MLNRSIWDIVVVSLLQVVVLLLLVGLWLAFLVDPQYVTNVFNTVGSIAYYFIQV